MGCVVPFGQTLEPKTFKICHVLLIAIFSMRGCVTHVAIMCEVWYPYVGPLEPKKCSNNEKIG